MAWSQPPFKSYMAKYKPLYDPTNPEDKDVGLTIVEVNGRNAERTNAEGVRTMLSEEVAKGAGEITLTVRGSGVFNGVLGGGDMREGQVLSTSVSPPSGVRPGATVSVTVLAAGTGRSKARDGDLLEISYNAYYLPRGETDAGEGGGRGMFDSSNARGAEVPTVQFVLNRQPFGQFPAAFNLACEGIRTGEVRRIVVPGVLGMEEEGRRRAKVPKDVEGYVYEIKGVLVNAMT